MTDRLGSAGREPLNGRVNGVQAPQSIQPVNLPVGPNVGRPDKGLGYKRDGMQISNDTRAIYAALVNGTPLPAGADPALMERLAMVHGPNSDLFQAVRSHAAVQRPLPPPPRTPLALAAPAEAPSETSTFFSRALRELNYAWQEFSHTQAW